MTTEITFPGSIPGMNSKDGLLRTHWRNRAKKLETFTWVARAATTNRHPGKVKVKLTRFSTMPNMDYDNLVSTGKLPIDAIVKARVIIDDKPAIIVHREYEQIKCSKSDQRTVITITDL